VEPADCQRGDAEPGADYMCERIGLFGSSSVGQGRVRYLGQLQDPNELALAVGLGIPLALAFYERRKTKTRALLVVATMVGVGVCTVLTRSRGGQLVFLTVMAVPFFRRYGKWGLVAGAVLAAPLLILGGRSGSEADASSLERLECWYEGMTMFKEYPILGVGQGEFVEHHYLTAHNSYVLALSELGTIGLFLWSVIIYITTKVPISAMRRLRELGPEAAVARTWAMGTLGAICGLLVGIFFLSFSYHPVLWIFIGLSGALYGTMKAHDPAWRFRFGWRDLVIIFFSDIAFIILMYIYTRVKAP
jgi:O-antigen ligase